MILDGMFAFTLPTITNSTTCTVSANVLDAGADVILFGGHEPLWLWFRATITADASPTLRIDLVASDNADGDPNDNETIRNVILASTGIITDHPTGTVALASGDTVELAIPIAKQLVARQYYMLLVTLGGTNPDLAAGQKAYVVRNPQTNMIGARAAAPA